MSKLLDSIGTKSYETEYFSPVPRGYKHRKTKYIVVFGTVMSGLGKGIFSASLAKLLKFKGLKVSCIKFDGYLNVDAGTLNPYRHGEVFVLNDGTESDMDLGTYERFLDVNLTKDNYLTGGKILTKVLHQERKGTYLGRDVQFLPHVTGEIKHFVRHLAILSKADIIFIEVGGTVGDIENGYFIEAMRELGYEEGKNNVCYTALTYVLEPRFLSEQKSKAAQLGINLLMSKGIQPDIIACRSDNPITDKIRQKISIFSNVSFSRVIGLHDCESIYEIPLLLHRQGIERQVADILGLKVKNDKKQIIELRSFVNRLENPKREINIGITGKYTGVRDSYASIIQAIEHCSAELRVRINLIWIDTTNINNENVAAKLKGLGAVIVPGGFGKRGAEGKICCVKYVRENNIPYLGICYGYQMAVIEFARNVCGLKGANSTEIDPKTKHPVIDLLKDQEYIESLGGNMRLGKFDAVLARGSLVHKLYDKEIVSERHRHRWESNIKYVSLLEKHGMKFSGRSYDGKLMEFLEIPSLRYFCGTQAHPEFLSRPGKPAPLFYGLVRAALKNY